MRKLVLTLLLPALFGCAAAPAVISAVSGISHTTKTVTLDGTIALTIAADAYTGVATLVTAAVNHGAFSSTQLQQIRSLNNQAIVLLSGDSSGLTSAQRASQLYLIVAELHKILGK